MSPSIVRIKEAEKRPRLEPDLGIVGRARVTELGSRMTTDIAPAYIAPNEDCQVVLRRMRLCRLRFVAEKLHCGPEEGSHAEKVTIFARYMDGMVIDTLKNAWLVLLPVSDGGQQFAPSSDHAIYGHTDKNGEIQWHTNYVPPKESGPSGGSPYFFKPGALYQYFWTWSPLAYRRACEAVASDVTRALNDFPFSSFGVFPATQPSRTTLVDLPERLPLYLGNSVKSFLIWTLLFQSGHTFRGWYSGQYIQDATQVNLDEGGWMGTKPPRKLTNPQLPQWDVDPSLDYIFASNEALSALFGAELLHHYALLLRQKQVETFTTFSQVSAIVAATQNKSRINDFDERNKYSINPAPEDVFEAFRDYAWRCAKNPNVTHSDFRELVRRPPDPPSAGFPEPRIALTDTDAACYPYVSASGVDEISGTLKFPEPIYNYFDFYRFGAEKADTVLISDSSDLYMASKIEAISDELRKWFERKLRYRDFMIALEAHIEYSLEERTALHERYLSLALTTGSPWWESIKYDFGEDGMWDNLKPWTSWLETMANKGFGILTVKNSLFGILTKPHSVLLAANIVRIDAQVHLAQMLDGLLMLDQRLSGTTLVPMKGGTVNVEVDYGTGLIKVTGDNVLEKIGPFHFTMKVEAAPKGYAVKGIVSKTAEVLPEGLLKPKSFQIKSPFETGKRLPGWIAAFASSAQVAHSICTVSKDLEEKENIIVLARVSTNVFTAVDSFNGMLGLLSRRVGTFVSRGAVVLEVAVNLVDSVRILSGKDDDLRKAFAEGKTTKAGLIKVKGGVLLVGTSAGVGISAYTAYVAGAATAAAVVPAAALPVGVTVGGAAAEVGLVATTAGSAWGVFLPPLGIALAATAIAVVFIEAAILYNEGPADLMQSMRDALNTAMKEEFGEDYALPGTPKGKSAAEVDRFHEGVRKLLNDC